MWNQGIQSLFASAFVPIPRDGEKRKSPAQPAIAYRNHAAVEPGVGLLEPCIRDVKITVLENEGALPAREELDPQSCLGHELKLSIHFRCTSGEVRVESARTDIEEGDNIPARFCTEAEKQSTSPYSPARMDGVADKAFVNYFETTQRASREVLGDQSNLRLQN